MDIKDPRYDYHITVSAQIIIHSDNQILLARRPDSWEWAPGRWCLLGGKLYQHESFTECIKRKTKQELGFELTPEALFQLKQLIIKEKQAHMYFFTAGYSGQKFTEGEMVEYRWFSLEDIKNIPSEKMAEYFLKDMLVEFLSGKSKLFPMDNIQSLNYIKLGNTKDYQKWFKGVINNNYNPDVIPDYKIWKENHKKGGE